jgi:hypothetical protein
LTGTGEVSLEDSVNESAFADPCFARHQEIDPPALSNCLLQLFQLVINDGGKVIHGSDVKEHPDLSKSNPV